MQSVPKNSFLAWVGHGHQQSMLWTSIASCSLSPAIEESWQGCLITSSPRCIEWYLKRIHLACPKKRCRHSLTLKIGMRHSMSPSLGCLAWRILYMSYWCFPQTSWSCKRLHITSPQGYQQDCIEERRHHGLLFHSGLASMRPIPWRMWMLRPRNWRNFCLALRVLICIIPTAYARAIVRRCITHRSMGHVIGQRKILRGISITSLVSMN